MPGLRGLDFDVPPFDQSDQERVLSRSRAMTRSDSIAAIFGMEWHSEAGRQIAAVVVDARGEVRGVQTKNQLDPTEEPLYVPGRTRQLLRWKGSGSA